MCGANCRHNCLIFQLHLLQAIRLQIDPEEITHFDKSNDLSPEAVDFIKAIPVVSTISTNVIMSIISVLSVV